MWEYAKNYNKYREIKYLLNMSQGTRGKMSKEKEYKKGDFQKIGDFTGQKKLGDFSC